MFTDCFPRLVVMFPKMHSFWVIPHCPTIFKGLGIFSSLGQSPGPDTESGNRAVEGKALTPRQHCGYKGKRGRVLHRPGRPVLLLPFSRGQSAQILGWTDDGSGERLHFPAPQPPLLSLTPALCSVLFQAPGFLWPLGFIISVLLSPYVNTPIIRYLCQRISSPRNPCLLIPSPEGPDLTFFYVNLLSEILISL